MRKLCLVAFTVLSICSFDQPVFANEGLNALKVDIAGRQRMLSQRIAKAACYMSVFSEHDKHQKMLAEATDLFAKSHDALRNGNKDMGLPEETNVEILRELDRLDPLWKKLHFASGLLLDTSSYPGVDVDMIMQFNLPTLQQANMTVQVMNNIFAKDEVKNEGLVNAINIAGRQRMLTQKSAKEYCLISFGFKVEENRKSLIKSVEMFDQALEDLTHGNEQKGIPAAPTQQILVELGKVKTNWRLPRQMMLDAANGRDPISSDFAVISSSNEKLLSLSQKIVKLMVDYSHGITGPQFFQGS